MGTINGTEIISKINGIEVEHTINILYSNEGVIIHGLVDDKDQEHDISGECIVTIHDTKEDGSIIFSKTFYEGRRLLDAECENSFQYTLYFGKDELLERQMQSKYMPTVHTVRIEELLNEICELLKRKH